MTNLHGYDSVYFIHVKLRVDSQSIVDTTKFNRDARDRSIAVLDGDNTGRTLLPRLIMENNIKSISTESSSKEILVFCSQLRSAHRNESPPVALLTFS